MIAGKSKLMLWASQLNNEYRVIGNNFLDLILNLAYNGLKFEPVTFLLSNIWSFDSYFIWSMFALI